MFVGSCINPSVTSHSMLFVLMHAMLPSSPMEMGVLPSRRKSGLVDFAHSSTLADTHKVIL